MVLNVRSSTRGPPLPRDACRVAAYGPRVLNIRPRSGSAAARWGLRGWPTLVRWSSDHPAVEHLYWALNELPGALAAEDTEVFEDLVAEAGTWLSELWHRPAAPLKSRAGEFVAVSTAVWIEFNHGLATHDLEYAEHHVHLLHRLVGPPEGSTPHRGPAAVPPYLPRPDRIHRGDHLPLVTAPVRDLDELLAGRPPHEQFLLLLLQVLSNQGGHLSDKDVVRCPPGSTPTQCGWTRAHGDPHGPMLGSLDAATGHLLLAPGAAMRAVRSAHRRLATGWTVADIGQGLFNAWLIDSTLDLSGPRRRTDVQVQLVETQTEQAVWRIPLDVVHPLQFFSSRPRERAPLRAVKGF